MTDNAMRLYHRLYPRDGFGQGFDGFCIIHNGTEYYEPPEETEEKTFDRIARCKEQKRNLFLEEWSTEYPYPTDVLY